MRRAVRHALRISLGVAMVAVGTGHFTATEDFRAQVPDVLPFETAIIYVSGVVEIALGAALMFSRTWRREVGIALAAFFVLVFPGNLNQAIVGIDAFGLDTPAKRWGRLALQPVLIAVALWSTKREPRR